MAKQYMKRCSTLLIIRERQIRTAMRYHLTLARIIKKPTKTKCWWGCGEKRTLPLCWWECKLVQPLWKIAQRFLKKLKVELTYDSTIPCLSRYLEKNMIQKDAPQCSLQHCLQQPRHGSNLSVHQQRNGQRRCTYMQWNNTQLLKRMK